MANAFVYTESESSAVGSARSRVDISETQQEKALSQEKRQKLPPRRHSKLKHKKLSKLKRLG